MSGLQLSAELFRGSEIKLLIWKRMDVMEKTCYTEENNGNMESL